MINHQQKSAVKNAADVEQVKHAKEKQVSRREREINDMAFILNTAQGRRLLWRYLEICGVFKSSFTGSSETFYLEGQRNVGLKILADITETSPEAYMLMMKEAKNREVNND